MATAIQWRRGTTAQHSSFTGLVGEITVDTDLDTLRVHDGSTAGGHRLAKYSEIGDITAVTAGDGLSGGGTSGALSIALDLNELTAATINVANDSIVLIDADDSNGSKKESVADFVSAIAGSGLSASSGQLSISETGDISAVTAGNGLSGGGSSGAVSLAINPSYFDKTDSGTGFAANFEPAANNTYSLGAATNVWKDVYIGPGSLYVNGTKVLEDSSGTIQFSANANQNIGIITSGSGDLELNASGTGTINIQSGVTVDSGQTITGTGGLTMASNINLDSNSINNLPAPAQANDAARKAYVDGASYLTGGDGITNSSGTIAVDSTVVRTTGAQTITGNKTFSNDVTVSGNFTVSGTTTTINTETLLLEDNIITLNSGTSGAPSENAGLQVDRGSSADVFFRYNEGTDKWQFTNDGSSYVNLAEDTDGLSEGSTNLYFTNARADARADARIAAADTDSLSEGSSNLYYTDERVADKIGSILSGSGNISVTYDDAADTITVSEALTTTDIAEGDNLYYTNARADARADVRIAANILDEDNFASDSATNTASQQSIKAYVAAQLATKDALSELSGDTDDVSEGSSNLYFTNARADARIAAADTDSLSEGSSNLYFTNARADARISNAIDTDTSFGSASDSLVPSQLAVKTYVDAQVDTADALSELSGDSDDITEGSTNLFHTSARVNTLIDARVTNSFVDALNVDADTLDGISSASFLRSDANDTHSGTITPNADNSLDLGSGSLRYNQVFAVEFNGTATSAKYADLAEKYETDAEIEAGSVVVFGGEKEITECDSECDHRVAGVISTDPAYMMNSDGEGQYLALTGRVPCKVVGPVAKGDLLVTSDVKGHAMVDNNAQPGRIIGKAVGSIDSGEGIIEVLVNMM